MKLYCDENSIFSVSDDMFLLAWYKKTLGRTDFSLRLPKEGKAAAFLLLTMFWTFYCLLELPSRIMKGIEIKNLASGKDCHND